MKKLEVKRYRKALEAKQSELIGRIRGSMQGLRDSVLVGDVYEVASRIADQHLTVAEHSRIKSILTQIGAAFGRIADRSYGTCESCSGAIPRKRLEAVPWAKYCVPCQEATERRNTPERPAQWDDEK